MPIERRETEMMVSKMMSRGSLCGRLGECVGEEVLAWAEGRVE